MKPSRSTRKRPRNQRVSNPRQRKQQHLLDVKVRSRKATQHRNRRVLVFISKIALAAAICAGIYFGARIGMRRFFFENPEYRLAMIDVQTDGTLQRDQVLKTADLREGENIFQVNLAHVHRVLQQLPQVDEVEVVRKLPGEIDIRILERKPIAWITSEKQSDVGLKWIGDLFFARDPGDRLALENANIDLARQLAQHLHFIHLRQLLQDPMYVRQVDLKNIFAFAQAGNFQNLIALQRAIRLHIDHGQAIVRIFEKEPAHPNPRTEIDSGADRSRQRDFRNENEHSPVAILRGLARSHLYVQQMLLFALARIGNALIAGPFAGGTA